MAWNIKFNHQHANLNCQLLFSNNIWHNKHIKINKRKLQKSYDVIRRQFMIVNYVFETHSIKKRIIDLRSFVIIFNNRWWNIVLLWNFIDDKCCLKVQFYSLRVMDATMQWLKPFLPRKQQISRVIFS